MAVVWGLIALLVGSVIAGLVGGIGWLVSLVGSTVGDGTAAWPADLVRNVGAVAAPFTVASSTWAAAFLSTDRMPAGRAVAATAVGVLILVGLANLESPAALVGAGGLAWALAIPFDRWSRIATRLGVLIVAALVIHVTIAGVVDGNPLVPWAIVIASSYPTAALVLWVADNSWTLAGRSSTAAQ